jgi:hypothetical protein
MQEQWRRAFTDDGEVDVRVGPGTALGMLVLGVLFGATATYLLLTPGAGLAPVGMLRFAGVITTPLALASLLYGVWMLVSPIRVIHLDQRGVQARKAPRAAWDEVEGVRTYITAGMTFAAVRFTPHYWERVEREDPELARKLRRDRDAQEGEVSLPGGNAGGGDAVQRLVLWAKQRVTSSP